MLKEFRDFAMRGNVIDLAVAVIIGGAFGKIVASLVSDIIMPLVGLLIGGVDFKSLAFTVRIAFVIFFMVRAINSTKKPAPAAAPTTKECPHCFTTIPLKATRCPNCTSQL
jgi:large conductance mechanosensitive channel